MPSTLNAPGIYIEELRSGVHPIVGVSTSDTAFVDWFPQGPVGVATRVTSFDEFERVYGGLHAQSAASYAVLQFFLNGGAVAWVVRVDLAADDPATATLADNGGVATLDVTARNPGSWGDSLRVAVTAATSGVNVVVAQVGPDGMPVVREVHRNLSTSAGLGALIAKVNEDSRLVRVGDNAGSANAPATVGATATGEPANVGDYTSLANGADAAPLNADGAAADAATLRGAVATGLQALTRIEPFVFNLLCLPVASTLGDYLDDLVDSAAAFCEARRAFLVVDPPLGANSASGPALGTWFTGPGAPAATKNAAIYWPRLTMPAPLARGVPRDVGPSGAVAGVMARTDATRGVWKAPAGIEAVLRGAELGVVVNEADSAGLNPLGVNVLRVFPVIGNVVWGARTLEGADIRASEWKYVSVRRTALYIEQSLDAGLKWVVFEPNDEPLWSQIRLNVGAFMQDLFRQQAFQGTTPREAYFVRCDKVTTTQPDIDRGVVNILVGFAPLKPAEFVVIRIQQMAGQATS